MGSRVVERFREEKVIYSKIEQLKHSIPNYWIIEYLKKSNRTGIFYIGVYFRWNYQLTKL
jgi:hypothetical protein